MDGAAVLGQENEANIERWHGPSKHWSTTSVLPHKKKYSFSSSHRSHTYKNHMENPSAVPTIPTEFRELLLDLAKGYIAAISVEDVDFDDFGLKYFKDKSSASSSNVRGRSDLLGQTLLSQRVAQIRQEGQVNSVAELYSLIKSEPLLVYIRDELKKFIIAYLTQKPEDVINFGVNYFEKRRAVKGKPKMPKWRPQSDDKEDEEIEVEVPRKIQRRAGVMSESVKVDEGTTVKLPNYPKTEIQKKSLKTAMSNVLLFKTLEAEQMEDILKAMFKVEVSRGDCVINQGEDGDYFYVIEKGSFEVFVKGESNKEEKVATFRDSGSFGELALMYNMPRVATVKAASGGLLWALDRDSFRKIVVESTFKRRRLYEELIASVPILSILSQDERSNLADSLEPKTFQNGACIITQGDAADGMYFVEDGTVEVMAKNKDGRMVSVDKVAKGGFFGELALVTTQPRAASAFARGVVKCAYLNVDAFERLLGPVKELMAERAKSYKVIEGADKVEVIDASSVRPGASGMSKNTTRISKP